MSVEDFINIAIDALGQYLSDLILYILYGWVFDAMEGLIDVFSFATNDVINISLHIEKQTPMTSGIVSADAIEKALFSVYLVMLGLLAIKLVWKGYKIYVLELDGDADISPLNLLKNAVFALCVAIAFPIVYEVVTELVVIVGNKFFEPFSVFTEANYLESLKGALSDIISRHLIFFILTVVYLVVSIILWIKMVMQGFELLIFRLGVPLAVVGLIDSDGGLWKSYIQQFIRQMATILVQGFCIKLSIAISLNATGGSLVCGIALLILSFKMPKMISSMLVSGGGGGGGSITTLSMVARAFVKGG